MERLKQSIRDFIGKDGCVYFEHGYLPLFNAYAVDYNGVKLRWRIGREKRSRIEFDEMDEDTLRRVMEELFCYMVYCQVYA